MKRGVADRLRAAELVTRVTDGGAHSNVLVDRTAGIDEAARATVTRLTMDTLRWMPLVDVRLDGASSRPLGDLDPMVRSVLRVAVTELLTGGAPHAAVDSAVEAVREARIARAAGFVNAVLRRVAAGLDVPSPDRTGEATTPPWIWERLASAWGADEAEAFLAAALAPAAIGVRLRPGSAPMGKPVPGIRSAAWLTSRAEAVAAAADVVVMDPASTAVALAVQAAPGMSVLDVAAAPGNKTGALWDAIGGEGLLVAADRHPRRSRSAIARLRRLGMTPSWVIADGARPPFRLGSFDRVLVDAPCTGLGTLRRRPEIKLRLDPAAPETLGAIQRTILESTLPLVGDGGRLIYAACTVFPEETVDIAAAFGGRPPDDLPGRRWGDGVLLAPHLTGTDGMFVTAFDR